jgi:hypothetical protein
MQPSGHSPTFDHSLSASNAQFIQYKKEDLVNGYSYFTDVNVFSPLKYVLSAPAVQSSPSAPSSFYEIKTSNPKETIPKLIQEPFGINDLAKEQDSIKSLAKTTIEASKNTITKQEGNLKMEMYNRKFGIIDGSGIPIYAVTNDTPNVFMKFVNYLSPDNADISSNIQIDLKNIQQALTYTFNKQPENKTTKFINAILQLKDIDQVRLLVTFPKLPKFKSLIPLISIGNDNDNYKLDPDFLDKLEVYREPIINQLLCFDYPSNCASPPSTSSKQNEPFTLLYPSNNNKMDQLYLILFGTVVIYAAFSIYQRK